MKLRMSAILTLITMLVLLLGLQLKATGQQMRPEAGPLAGLASPQDIAQARGLSLETAATGHNRENSQPAQDPESVQPSVHRHDPQQEPNQNMSLVGQLGGIANDLAIQNQTGYLGLGPRLVVLNIETPEAPQFVGESPVLPDLIQQVDPQGRYIYVADGSGGLRVIDVQDPRTPVEAGFFDTPGEAWGVTVAGKYAYVADRMDGLRVVDISDPSNPNERGYVDTPGEARAVAVDGNYAYVADSFGGLRIIDVSDPSHPQEVSSYDTPGFAYDVASHDGKVFVADAASGVRVINVADPQAPGEIASFDTPGYATQVQVAGKYIYVADEQGGLVVLEYAPQPPSLSMEPVPAQPGSFLTVTGANFPPRTEIAIAVNGQELGSIKSTVGGRLVFLLATEGMASGRYAVTAPGYSGALATFTIDQRAPLRLSEYSWTTLTVPAQLPPPQVGFLPFVSK